MATIILSAAGAAIGGSVGGSVLGLSLAAAGRFAGAVIGRSIDQRLLGQGSDAVEAGRVSRLRLTGAGEGDAIAQVFGRTRVSGQVIWATEFLENVTVSGGGGGGKGGSPPTPRTEQFSYSLSLAVAVCEGEISHVGRIWADGNEVPRDRLNMQVYTGSADQLPDPRIEAVEGAGTVPAYRGTAYVVIEDLELGDYGNRVPQFSFEVMRPAQPGLPGASLDPSHAVRGVAMLPGSGEYVLATTPIQMNFGAGSTGLANVISPSGQPDFLASLDNLSGEMPACRVVSLIVSWFGDDLRCGTCTIRPKVEQQNFDSRNMPWQVAGLTRGGAQRLAQDADGRPIYGGTPSDASVIQAIGALKAARQEVMYYPFILMDQISGNGLPDPHGDTAEQPALPWRGRISLSKAPGQPGSPDGTAGAEAEVAAFFGTAAAGDFAIPGLPPEGGDTVENADSFLGLISFSGPVTESPVVYSGPQEWGYRRFVLHQAALCKAAGGVESFCIGSEIRGLTQVRGPGNSFPVVAQLISLAAEVRDLLGPDVKIGYAADWSEYFGYQPADGSGDRFFHLDPLWADDNIDFVGIDNYMPVSDWRDGQDHLDAQEGWSTIYDIAYLRSNMEGGEGYDWYYASPEDRAAQIRTPITDAAHGEPWVWRYKDIRNWWRNPHHERIGGQRAAAPTAWIPESKPVRFTEYGCAAIDKGTNQPNKFLDPKSSESQLPNHSAGHRDELIQQQYLRAMAEHWSDPAKNPVSAVYGGPMIDLDHAYAWAWDARPYPAFPGNRSQWNDGANYIRGHWITGRSTMRSLASVVDEIAVRAGLEHRDTSRLYGAVRGYLVDQVSESRAALQPLMLRYGFDAVERNGVLEFRMRDGRADHAVDPSQLVRDPEIEGTIERTRGSTAELAGRVRLRFVEADGNFEVIAEEAVLPDEGAHAVATSEFPLVMTRGEGRQTVERWLSESRVATDTLRLTLPPSQIDTGAGDVISLPEEGGSGLYRIDRVERMAGAQKLEAVRIEPESYRPLAIEADSARLRSLTAPGPVTAFFLDLPLLTGEEVPHAPHVAVTSDSWFGPAAVHASDADFGYQLNRIIAARTPIGVTENVMTPGRSGLVDRGEALAVRMLNGALSSVDDPALLNGANLCAVGGGSPGGWELFQFRDAELTEPDTYSLSYRLRGQLGTEGAGEWPAGSYIVLLDGTPQQIELAEAKRGQARHYRVGPAGRPFDDPAYSHGVIAFDGIGLRPLSPVHLKLKGAPSSDMELSWIRRTRIGGDRWETPDVPLGEESELYAVRVVQNEATLREETVTAPVWTYTAAAQAADAISGAYELQVAQISAHFGSGPAASLKIDP